MENKKNKFRDPYSSYESFLESNREINITKNERENQNKIVNNKRRILAKIMKIFFLTITFLSLFWGIYFSLKIGFVGKKINIENDSSSVIGNIGSLISSLAPSEKKPLKGEQEGRINILLLGTAGKGKPGQNLTDTIILMSVDTKDKKIALLSLPRDFYANIPKTSYFTKINSIYQYGINRQEDVKPMKKTVEEITGVSIHYFIILDFEGFEKIIDDIGGINIQVERDIYDSRYPGPNYSYETFEIKKGLHLMDGKTALKYVRERHGDPEGDFGRAKRQQQVMQAAKNKAFSLQTFLNPLKLNSLLDNLGDNIKTDIKLEETERFINLSKKCDTQNITNVVIDAWNKESVLKVSHIFSGGTRFFVLVPRVGNYSEIQDLSENIFDLDSIRRRKAEIEKENASITIINKSQYGNLGIKIKGLLENKMGIKEIKMGYLPEEKTTEEISLIYDNAGGQKIFTTDEIIKKLGVKLGEDKNGIIKKQASDLILVLGNDLKNIGSFEEDTLDELKNSPDSQEYFNLIEHK